MHKIHFIAIGGSVMHDLAIALKQAGYAVTGSDDAIFEPARSVLERHHLLPPAMGWHPERITPDLDAVILGMHASGDNPELLRAQELNIRIMSYPEFIFDHAKNKHRIVIAGSHGKTTITGIIIHVLTHLNRKFDFLIGSNVRGMEQRVRLSKEAPVMVIEGDEYLASALDQEPKFLKYHHHIGLISGISWDHANVFRNENDYMQQFERFADTTPKGGTLVYYENDPLVSMIGAKDLVDVQRVPYKSHPHTAEKARFKLTVGKERIPIRIFGGHNLQNISGAREVLKKIAVTNEEFYEAIKSFEGVAGRLEKVAESRNAAFFKDFAHAPSKVRASIQSLREMYPSRDMVACLELHTYSSLSKDYLPQYADSLKGAQEPIVYYDPKTVSAKKLGTLTPQAIQSAFGAPAPMVFDEAAELEKYLLGLSWRNKNLLTMSSGHFGGLNFKKLAKVLSATPRK